MGSGAFVEEDPAKLAARGAVVVTFNIRLNIFGFLAHPALSAESPHASSGNYGLLDQAAAFAWVRRNIESFGGDPDRVTFFGQSAGATLGMLLLSSPIVDRPYDRAIFQSPGSFSALLPLEEAERHGAPLGATADEIRSIEAGQLLDRAKQLPAVPPSLWLARPLRPIADGWVIPSTEPMASGHFPPLPAIIGINEDEGSFFGPRMNVRTTDDFVRFLTRIFGENSTSALERYPVKSDEDVPAMFSAVYGDRGFTYPIEALARAFVDGGADIYRYVYTYRHGALGRPPTHADEIGVLLDNLPHMRAEDAAMAEQMASYWLAFAATGDPNHAGATEWPRLDDATDRILRLDCPPALESRWRSEFARFVAENRVD
jgi:para-nitrobenzyl esterase